MTKLLAPLMFAAALAGCSVLPGDSGGSSQPSASRPVSGSAPYSLSGQAGRCLAELGRSGAKYTPLPDRYIDNGCSNLNTVQLTAVPADSAQIAVANLGPVTCSVSQAFTGWTRFGVDRAARQVLGSPLRSIETFGSYSCRNIAGTARRSAHSTAAAIDISGFVLEDGRRITVKNDWNGGTQAEREFLRLVQRSACKRFDTVLGPDYNAAHHDHFHVEGVIDGKSYCR